ncbi:hypothetical protein BB560_000909 [Smittium megazygosporum]|uniref:Protein kinase domain-containing protein n=1 Tax=Smittium megazygosporum TaxID=133381 RepID=A0A2T9ZIZ1_9FUNG|nr:hypothetical protein BB560_000909 [Smittium megazygosporum]
MKRARDCSSESFDSLNSHNDQKRRYNPSLPEQDMVPSQDSDASSKLYSSSLIQRPLSSKQSPNYLSQANELSRITSNLKNPNQILQKEVDLPKEHVFVGCSKYTDYSLVQKVGEGTFGEVHRATHLKTGGLVALKRVLMHNEKEGIPITAIREIKILKSLNHPNIVPLIDMVIKHETNNEQNPNSYQSRSSVYMVFPYYEHDLAGLLENPKIKLTIPMVKLYLRQICEGTAYIHQNNILHRDMKGYLFLKYNSL